MKVPIKVLGLAWFLMCLPITSNADPSPTVMWLMEEPANLFDLGMLRLKERNEKFWVPRFMEQYNDPNLQLRPIRSSEVGYNYRDNFIEIKTRGMQSESVPSL